MAKRKEKETEKDCRISFRMTKEERVRLDRLTEQSGLSISDLVRSALNGVEIRQRQGAEIGQLYTEIDRIGNNINQIARSVNAGIADAKESNCGFSQSDKI